LHLAAGGKALHKIFHIIPYSLVAPSAHRPPGEPPGEKVGSIRRGRQPEVPCGFQDAGQRSDESLIIVNVLDDVEGENIDKTPACER
jgi:hypothetical protein